MSCYQNYKYPSQKNSIQHYFVAFVLLFQQRIFTQNKNTHSHTNEQLVVRLRKRNNALPILCTKSCPFKIMKRAKITKLLQVCIDRQICKFCIVFYLNNNPTSVLKQIYILCVYKSENGGGGFYTIFSKKRIILFLYIKSFLFSFFSFVYFFFFVHVLFVWINQILLHNTTILNTAQYQQLNWIKKNKIKYSYTASSNCLSAYFLFECAMQQQ